MPLLRDSAQAFPKWTTNRSLLEPLIVHLNPCVERQGPSQRLKTYPLVRLRLQGELLALAEDELASAGDAPPGFLVVGDSALAALDFDDDVWRLCACGGNRSGEDDG
jgi:hypothetical protein